MGMTIITTTAMTTGTATITDRATRIRRKGSGAMFNYLRDAAKIYEKSFGIVRAETDLSRFSAAEAGVVVRLVHAVGEPAIARDLAAAGDWLAAGRQALADGAAVLVDSQMVAAGIQQGNLPGENPIVCTLTDQRVPKIARLLGNTRSASAVELWRPRLLGAVVAIGNAPTALFRLLEGLAEGWPKPAAILAFPVGFVGAAESKDALIQHAQGVPYLTLRGRRGGSALAAAAVNALALSGEGA
jgi:precorrin-8X/cobalt-precorrin-8 methylmutase